MAPEPRPRIEQLIQSHATPSRVLSAEEVELDKRLVVVCEAFLYEFARRFVESTGGRPFLVSYGADGTPMTSRRLCAQKVGALAGIRSGFEGQEFCVQNACLRSVDSAGRSCMCYVTRPPLPMVEGKSGWHFYQAWENFALQAKPLGHSGCSSTT